MNFKGRTNTDIGISEHVLHGWRGYLQCSVFCHPTTLKLPLKMRKLQGAKVRIVMLDALVFWILFPAFQKNLCHEQKLISPKPTVLRHFSASGRRFLWFNHNILRIASFYMQNRVGYPNSIPTSGYRPSSFSTVTACVPVLNPARKMYHEANILACWANSEAFLPKSANMSRVEKCAG